MCNSTFGYWGGKSAITSVHWILFDSHLIYWHEILDVCTNSMHAKERRSSLEVHKGSWVNNMLIACVDFNLCCYFHQKHSLIWLHDHNVHSIFYFCNISILKLHLTVVCCNNVLQQTQKEQQEVTFELFPTIYSISWLQQTHSYFLLCIKVHENYRRGECTSLASSQKIKFLGPSSSEQTLL